MTLRYALLLALALLGGQVPVLEAKRYAWGLVSSSPLQPVLHMSTLFLWLLPLCTTQEEHRSATKGWGAAATVGCDQ